MIKEPVNCSQNWIFMITSFNPFEGKSVIEIQGVVIVGLAKLTQKTSSLKQIHK